MLKVGSIVDSKYEILKKIGQGGMSVVYLAIDNRLNKSWAIKEIRKESNLNNQVVVQSLLAEANMLKKLDHPALPRIVDIIEEQGSILVVMDYIEGESLNKVLEREGAQSQEQVIEWAKHLCDALDYLHTRKPSIIYRDMKPANIMLQMEGRVKLIDFGTAREYKEDNVTDTVSLGTKGYAAPEQFGNNQTDARTDIYCLGATLYHLVTGKNPSEPPYTITPIRQLNPTLSGGFENIILKCTRPNPDDRYQSCAELLYALEHYDRDDEIHKRILLRKILVFSVSVFMLLLSLSVSALGFNGSNNLNSNNFDSIILGAQSYDSQKLYNNEINQYLKVYQIYPNLMRQDDYISLLSAYEKNNQLVEGTKKVAAMIIQDQLLQKQPELCRQVALNYFINYKNFYQDDSTINPFNQAKLYFGYAYNVDTANDKLNDNYYMEIAEYMLENQSSDTNTITNILTEIKKIDGYYGSSHLTGNDMTWLRNKMCLVTIEYNNISADQSELLALINTDAEQVLNQLSNTSYSSTLTQQQINSDKILMEFFDAESYKLQNKLDLAITHYNNCLALNPDSDIESISKTQIVFCKKSQNIG